MDFKLSTVTLVAKLRTIKDLQILVIFRGKIKENKKKERERGSCVINNGNLYVKL
jgi:hypothetical protein